MHCDALSPIYNTLSYKPGKLQKSKRSLKIPSLHIIFRILFISPRYSDT